MLLRFPDFFVHSAIVSDGTIEERGPEGQVIHPGDEEEPFFRDRQMIAVKQTHVYVGVSIFNFQGFIIYHEKCENKTPLKITNHTVVVDLCVTT